MGIIGIVANPSSGKDIRRLVARASVFDNQEKQAIVQRALAGMIEGGATRIAYFDDGHHIVRNALEESSSHIQAQAVDSTRTATALDTISSARAFKEIGCDVVITLGGDGTNRAFALGWQNAPLIPLFLVSLCPFPATAIARFVPESENQIKTIIFNSLGASAAVASCNDNS